VLAAAVVHHRDNDRVHCTRRPGGPYSDQVQ
jgi:hypothetical protein